MSWDWEKLKEQQKKRGHSPPPLDEVMEKFGDLKKTGGPIIIIALIILALIGYSIFYTIGIDEQGVVQRFGQFVRISYPGPNFKWPLIEKVTKVKVKRVYKKEFGFRSTRSAEQSDYRKNDYYSAAANRNVSLMLTGDLNVGLVPWIVQYRIDNPVNYLFKVREPEKLLEDMAEAAMSLVVGDRSINEVISKRREIADECAGLLQIELDQAQSGIQIRTIEMKKTNVPEPVQASFNEINQAMQEKETLIYQAKEDYNKAIPAAEGEAERTVKTAEGYQIDRVNRAQGEAARFAKIYKEFIKAKEITKKRLYLETMRTLIPKMGRKYIIDADQKNFLPMLNIGKETGSIK